MLLIYLILLRKYILARLEILKFLKDRDFGLENSSIGLYFNGANGEFQELPLPKDMLIGNQYEKYRKLN